jgi:glycerol-3-phosphate acyltransferase PlsY
LVAYIICLLAGYTVGSFPTAYLLVRWKSRLDIRHVGSGNVGTMNTFDVTRSKAVSLAVLLGDVLKGVLAVLVGSMISPGDPWISLASGAGVVLGHNYPVWLSFKGGRGLATAAGVFLLTGWVFVPLWLAIFGAVYQWKRDIHTGNVIALVLAPILVWLAPDPWLGWFAFAVLEFRVLVTLLCGLIMLRHIDVLPAVFAIVQPTSHPHHDHH